MSSARRAILSLSVLVILLCQNVLPLQDRSEPRYKVKVDAVLYELWVRNARGVPVRGLSPKDFLILENGNRRPIVFFREQSEEGLSLAILLDIGSSMSRESILTGKELIFQLIHSLDPNDEILLATFEEDAYFLSDLTRDRYQLLESIENISPDARPRKWSVANPSVGVPGAATLGIAFSPSNSNTGYAVDLALLELRKSFQKNRIVLVISAGFANMGEATVDHLRLAGARFFGVGFGYKLGNIIGLGSDWAVSKKTVSETGGISYSGSQILEQVAQLRDSMKNSYLLAYEPAEGDGEEMDKREVEFRMASRFEYEIRATRCNN